jgi:FMN phosphatase YigB (HAD superfamily)
MIQNILFDVGTVLLNIHYEPALALAHRFCDPAKREALGRFFTFDNRDPMIREYERGAITTEDFFLHFATVTGFSGTMDQFVRTYQDMLSENELMLEFARALSRTYNTFLVTNAGVLHTPTIYARFPSLLFFKEEASSCYLGEVKPDRAFYEKALAKFGVEPITCLLIDDRPENCAGARAFGIHAILYTQPDETIAAVRTILASEFDIAK